MNKIFIIIISCMLCACSTYDSAKETLSTQESLSLDFSQQPKIMLDNRVVRGEQVVSIHPNKNLTAPPTALFIPFGLTQNADQKSRISDGLSRMVWQQFLNEETFSVLEYANTTPPYRIYDALSYARQRNAEFMVGGYVTYYFDGGSLGSTRISIIVEVYDVSNGNLLWSIAHAGEMPAEKDRDFSLFSVETKMPYDPTYVVTSTIANDIARLLTLWTTPAAVFEENPSSRRAF